nr:hypothetical protein GCM10025730_03580 [Promicromonospora thailandica]
MGGGADQLEHAAYVGEGGVGVEQGELEAGPAVDDGLGDQGAAGVEQHAAHLGHEGVGALGVEAVGLVAEQHGGQVGGADDAEVAVGGEVGVDGGGQVADGVDERTDAVRAEGPQRDPELEGVEPAGGLQGLVDLVEVGVGLAVLLPRVEVVGVPGDGRQVGTLAHDQRAGGHGLEERLVEVDGDAAGSLDAGQQVAARGADQEAAAVGGVDVQPRADGVAQVGHGAERVDAAAVGGAGGRDDGDHDVAGALDVDQGAGQGVGAHAAVGVGADGDHGVVGQAEQQGGLGDAEVAHAGGQDPHGLQARARPAGLLARQEQGLEVRLGAARGEDAVGATGGEADPARRPLHEAPFHERGDRGLVVGVDRGVDGGEHRLGAHRGQRHGAVQVRGVGGHVEPDRVLRVQLACLAQRLGRAGRRPVEVDGVDKVLQLGAAGAREGLGDGREPGRDVARDVADRVRVGVGRGPAQQRGRVVVHGAGHGRRCGQA